MDQHMRNEAADDDREIRERLRAMRRPTMSRWRVTEIIGVRQATEDSQGSLAASLPWWRRPVPLWRAIAASIVLSGASVAIALGIARNSVPEEQAPIADFAVNKVSAPAAIVFVEHEW